MFINDDVSLLYFGIRPDRAGSGVAVTMKDSFT